MALSIPVTWSDAHRLHSPETTVWIAVSIASDESPERADLIRSGLEGAGATVVAAEQHADDALVVALGVDAAAGDPNAPLAATEAGIREAGRLLAMRNVPTVFVQEGGYVTEAMGPLVRAMLDCFEEESR